MILDFNGNTIVETDVFYETNKDPERINHIKREIVSRISPKDVVCIENMSFGSSGRAVTFLGGLGWLIRDYMFENGIEYFNVPPKTLKKFVTGKGRDEKNLDDSIESKWGFSHPSEDVLDAYGLAQMARAIYMREDYPNLKDYEREAVESVLTGKANNPKINKTNIPPWRNPRSKYYNIKDINKII